MGVEITRMGNLGFYGYSRKSLDNHIIGGAPVVNGSQIAYYFYTTGNVTISNDINVELLLVGGGGSGSCNQGGGGGAGGAVYFPSIILQAGVYTVTVGTGGATETVNQAVGNSGNNTVFYGITALGGGGGAGMSGNGLNGGCGGGGFWAYSRVNGVSTQSQFPGAVIYGNRGSDNWNGGGGGGCGTTSSPSGNAGYGKTVMGLLFGGGGGGSFVAGEGYGRDGGGNGGANGYNGSPATGIGCGGGAGGGAGAYYGGAGSDGIVIVRYSI